MNNVRLIYNNNDINIKKLVIRKEDMITVPITFTKLEWVCPKLKLKWISIKQLAITLPSNQSVCVYSLRCTAYTQHSHS